MCGITGIQIFNTEKSSFLDSADRSVIQLKERGPDNNSTYKTEKTALAHARISIIDTGAGANQPFERGFAGAG